jgi:predicted acyl esterase
MSHRANRRRRGRAVRYPSARNEDPLHRFPKSSPVSWVRTPGRVPLLSAANWGGMGCHTHGKFESYLAAASTLKWLSVHGNTHFARFYRAAGEELQKRFFGHLLRGQNTGWDQQPPVQLDVRHRGEKFTTRDEQEWPLARTQWTKCYLDPQKSLLTTEPKQADSIEYETLGDGLTFSLPVSDTRKTAQQAEEKTRLSDWRGLLKKRLTGPAVLEMCRYSDDYVAADQMMYSNRRPLN